MRFEIGTSYLFLRVLFTAAQQRFFPLYCPWEDTLVEIQMVELECIEHHRVPVHSDKLEADGFLFKDKDGNRWANQYPRASYGQLDDSADGRVRRYFEDNELLVYDEHKKPVMDDHGNQKRTALWSTYEDQFFKPFVQAERLLDSVYRGTQEKVLSEEMRKALKEHLKELEAKIGEAHRQVVYEPLVFELTDGTKEASNIIYPVVKAA